MEGQPVVSCVNEGSAFGVEARVLRDIEWRPPTDLQEPLISRRDAPLPRFNSETAATQIPMEIWNMILGYLRREPETLGITEEVCMAWYPTSHHLKTAHITKIYDSVEEVCLSARYMKTIPRPRRVVEVVYLEGSAAEQGKQRGLAHVGTFSAMLAGGQLPRLSWLWIQHGEWTPGAIPHSVFLHLSTFTSITLLTLYHITLPSTAVLLRLVCALDHMEWLDIDGLRLLDRRVPPASRRWVPSPNLKKLTFGDLNWPDHLCTLRLYTELETSSGSATILLLSKAVNCLELQQLLHHAGKALRVLHISPLVLLPGRDSHGIQLLYVSDVDLSRNVGLKSLDIGISGHIMPPALLEKAETYDVIQQIISSASPTTLETIIIRFSLNGSLAGPAIMSHVLLALRTAVFPPGHLPSLEKYMSLRSLRLEFSGPDESTKRQMEADWVNLAPIWFSGLYSRGIITLNVFA